ncbi:efflux RND transporter periplasmic adaptor subunit [Sagittula sp. S175]|uniref:efflux RND transporter periplasmic adaptor subunit n=1 Tax=Sagittula sp. S175 TaxID=3415129 RepID=UPI003C79929D
MVWTTRTTLLSAAGAAMIGGLAWVAFRDTPVPVDLVPVTRAPLAVTIDADGKTRIRDLYEISAPISGTAQRAPVAVGDPVAQGVTVIANLQPLSSSLLDARSRAQAEAAVAEARAALDVARTELARTEEQQTFATMQYDRTKALANRGVATLTQLESDTQAVTLANAAVTAARASVTMAEGTLSRAEAALLGPDGPEADSQCCVTLTAPTDGVVLSITQISEHPVTAGQSLLTIGDPDNLEIIADLLSSDAVRIAPGTKARVERWGGPETLEATLDRIEPAAETRVSALGIEEQRVDAIFTFTSPIEAHAGLGHGFAVYLRIVEWETDATLQIPLGALFRKTDGNGDRWAVFTVIDGLAREQTVTLGHRSSRMVEILDGVTEGDLIVTHPSDAVRDGVTIIDRNDL